jgi:hypothetical protein
MKRLLYAAVALLCVGLSLSASAQMTTITATNISMGGTPVSVGAVTLTPVDAKGKPIPFVQGGGGLNSPQPFTCKVQNGAIVGICQVPDSKLTTPPNLSYSIQISSTVGQKAFVMNAVPNITGSTWSLSDYAPSAQTTNVESIQVSYGSGPPSESCVAPSFYVRNASGGLLYMCVNSEWVLVTESGGSASVTPEAMSSAVATLTGCSDPTKSWSPAANACVANTGPKGDTGSTGVKGDQGNPGAKGDTGAAGQAATITVGTVTTGAAGSSASVTNSGTSSAAVLDFVIPQGAKGSKGDKGDAGTPGADGSDGAAASVTVGTVTALSPGDSPTVTNSGTSSAAVLDFGLPTTGTRFWSCQPGLGDGLNEITIGTYIQWTCRNDTGSTVTLTGISCIADSGTSTLSATNGSGTALLSSAISCGTSYTDGTQSATTTLESGDFIELAIAVDGSKQVAVDIKGTL